MTPTAPAAYLHVMHPVVDHMHGGLPADLPGGWAAERLHAAAEEARANAYAPYSSFMVGAALLDASGALFTGVNVENGSYGLTICAERAAVVQAVTHGAREIAAIAVAGDTERVSTLACCGACLQVLAEFDPGHQLVVIFPDAGVLRSARLAELLPVQFRLKS